MMISNQFEEQLMQAIVRQFFENPPVFGTLPDGTVINIPARPTPAQVVAARLLSDKNEALLAAILEAVDIDVLAGEVAEKMTKTLLQEDTRYGYGKTPGEAHRKVLKERVDNRLVELLAQDLYARIKDDGEHIAHPTPPGPPMPPPAPPGHVVG